MNEFEPVDREPRSEAQLAGREQKSGGQPSVREPQSGPLPPLDGHLSLHDHANETEPFDPLPPELADCRACPRLVEHRERIAREKRRSYRNQEYWGRPVPGFGDPRARIVMLGLAPGAHGSNRTGRMFTGDASGDFLYPALYRAGFASGPHAVSVDDGLVLDDLWITSSARCVPPGNKPVREELDNCRRWLEHDFDGLTNARLVIALGSIGHDSYLELLRQRGVRIVKRDYPFGHGRLHQLGEVGGIPLLDSFHPSFQNTNTGRLTAQMMDELLARARTLAEDTAE